MKIDVFNHLMTKKYIEGLSKKARPDYDFVKKAVWSTKKNSPLIELDIRFRLMDRHPDVLQVPTIGAPPLEMVVKSSDAADLAKTANDELAEITQKYPDRFIGAVACLPLSDMDAALKEVDRTLTDLHFRGVEIFTHVNGESIASPELMPLYEKMAGYDLPIWIHPISHPDRPVKEPFGWPTETSLALLDLVAAGVFQKYPDIKFIVHHCGALVPFFSQRIRTSWTRHAVTEGSTVRDPLDHLQRLYVDTAVYGNPAALMCGHAFFGAEHMLFGTDAPLGAAYSEHGLTQLTIDSIKEMQIPDADKEKIFIGNAIRLLRLDM